MQTKSNAVSSSNYGSSTAAYESSVTGVTGRQSRYSSSRAEERITAASNGAADLNQSINSRSYSAYSSITGGATAVGKPVIKRTCKGVTIERKLLWDIENQEPERQNHQWGC